MNHSLHAPFLTDVGFDERYNTQNGHDSDQYQHHRCLKI